jgi:hypothetical protein
MLGTTTANVRVMPALWPHYPAGLRRTARAMVKPPIVLNTKECLCQTSM